MKMKKIIIPVVIVVVLVSGIYLLGKQAGGGTENTGISDNVKQVGGQQVVEIFAKGGYSPRDANAQAGVETVLKITTNGTFDCSSSLVIPSLNYRKFLQPTGVEQIIIPADKASGKLRGLCGMGMYSFEIRFQ